MRYYKESDPRSLSHVKKVVKESRQKYSVTVVKIISLVLLDQNANITVKIKSNDNILPTPDIQRYLGKSIYKHFAAAL